MPLNTRFGRRIPLPSTRQIKHDLRVMMLQELEQRAANEIASQGVAQETPRMGATDSERVPT